MKQILRAVSLCVAFVPMLAEAADVAVVGRVLAALDRSQPPTQ